MDYLTLIADDPEGIYHNLFTHDFQLYQRHRGSALWHSICTGRKE
jgi:hypothetical protein